jgi:hypothetical protein
MALNNIFREPRREITESVLGLAAVITVAYLDYHLSAVIKSYPSFKGSDISVIAITIPWLVGAGTAILWLFLQVTHMIGEGICNSLARRGLELRPRKRASRI